MVTISNFSSVFEIAFAINALFYIFELGPLYYRKIEDRYKECMELAKKKVEVTQNHYFYPIGFVLGSTFLPSADIYKFTSIIFSFLSLAILIFSGFYPDVQISTFWMILILLMLFSTPFFATLSYLKAIIEISSSEEILKQQISDAENEKPDTMKTLKGIQADNDSELSG